MRIEKTNNINFGAIKLSQSSFKHTEELVSFLKKSCVDVVGHRTFYVNNDFDSKLKTTQYVRSKYNFKHDECGIVLFPWSGETWVVARRDFEQELYPLIKDYDEKAIINLLL